MNTCFLFLKQQDEETILSLTLSEEGHVLSPLAFRTFDEIHDIQNNAKTLVILPTEMCSLHQIELAWLSEKKARLAIPFALEEQLAQPVNALHFAFDRAYYKDRHYLVMVIDKDYLKGCIQYLQAHDIVFEGMTIDWFALELNEACVTDSHLLIYTDEFKGALGIELYALYTKQHTLPETTYLFSNSTDTISMASSVFIDGPSSLWLARRIQKRPWINLCQGDFQQQSLKKSSRNWFLGSAALISFWVLSFLMIHLYQLFSLNHSINQVEKQIAVIYHEFFPESKQVISPRFRVQQLLSSQGMNQHGTFWDLLINLALAYNAQDYTIESLSYQNQVMSITFMSKDFNALEKIQQKLQQANIKVSQTEASSREGKILATLELKK